MSALVTAYWLDNGRAAQRSFLLRREAIEFARERVQSESCGPVALWRYESKGTALALLMEAHDGGEWWDTRTYVGCVLKNGSFTSR